MTPKIHFWLLPLGAALAVGCGDGDLSLRLVTVSFDKPYDEVETLQVRLLDERLVQLQTLSTSPGGPADLGVVPQGSARRLEVLGLTADGNVRSRGNSRPLDLEPDLAREELIPFGSLDVAVGLPASRSLGASPTVDGLLDEWVSSPSLVLDDRQRVAGPRRAPGALLAELMIGWEPGKLRFALAVRDGCTTLVVGEPVGDCSGSTQPDRITLGIDGNASGGDYGAGDFYLEAQATRLTVLAGVLSPEQIELAFAPLPGGVGWAVEGAIDVAAFGRNALQAGDRIGLELAVVDEAPGTEEPTVLRLSGASAGAAAITPTDLMASLGLANP